MEDSNTKDFVKIYPKIDMFVNATSYERYDLYIENANDKDWLIRWNNSNDWDYCWKDNGYQIYIGNINGLDGLPVFIRIYVDKIEEYHVGFYERVGRLFDSEVVDKWINENYKTSSNCQVNEFRERIKEWISKDEPINDE